MELMLAMMLVMSSELREWMFVVVIMVVVVFDDELMRFDIRDGPKGGGRFSHAFQDAVRVSGTGCTSFLPISLSVSRKMTRWLQSG